MLVSYFSQLFLIQFSCAYRQWTTRHASYIQCIQTPSLFFSHFVMKKTGTRMVDGRKQNPHSYWACWFRGDCPLLNVLNIRLLWIYCKLLVKYHTYLFLGWLFAKLARTDHAAAFTLFPFQPLALSDIAFFSFCPQHGPAFHIHQTVKAGP